MAIGLPLHQGYAQEIEFSCARSILMHKKTRFLVHDVSDVHIICGSSIFFLNFRSLACVIQKNKLCLLSYVGSDHPYVGSDRPYVRSDQSYVWSRNQREGSIVSSALEKPRNQIFLG